MEGIAFGSSEDDMADVHHLLQIGCSFALLAACSESASSEVHSSGNGGRESGVVTGFGGGMNDGGAGTNTSGVGGATGGTSTHPTGGTGANGGTNDSGGVSGAGHGATANGANSSGPVDAGAGAANRGGTGSDQDGGDGAPNGAGGSAGNGGEDAAKTGNGDPCKTDPGNNDLDHATEYALGTDLPACITGASDVDYYQFTTPNHIVDGYVVVTVSDIVERYMNLYTNELQVDVYPGSDTHSLFYVYNDSSGKDINLWFAAAAGTTYRIRVQLEVSGFSYALTSYTFHASFTPIEDMYEPNQSEGAATPISLGQTIHAYMSGGYTSAASDLGSAWWDFYEFTLAAGSATIKLTDLPNDLRFDAYVYDDLDPAHTQIRGYAYNMTAGQDIIFNTDTNLPAGKYYLQLDVLDTYTKAYGSGTTPANYLTHPYALTVTQ
jgi:hypothetical protein